MKTAAVRAARRWPHWYVPAAVVVSASALLATHLAAPSQTARYCAYTAVAALAAYALGRGVDRHRPRYPRGWRLLEVGLWLHTGYGLTLLAQALLPGVTALLVAESLVDNVAHLFMAGAAVRFLAIRRPGRDRDGLLDAGVVLLAGGLLFWQVYEQHDRLATALTLPVLSAAAVALLMAAAVVMGVRLYPTDRPPPAFPVLMAAATLALTGNLVVVATRPVGAPPRWVELCWLLGVLLAALAAHLPGMRVLGEPERPRERTVSASRVVALGAALLVSPALVVLWGTRATEHPGPLAAVVALLTVLVLWRIGRLVSEREGMRRQLVAVQAQLVHQASHDALTGLANRSLFLDRAAAALTQVDAPPAVVFIDLDGFKAVNDTYGHAAGDELLTVVAVRLQSCLRATDLAARLGGDEFAVLVAGTADPEAAPALARRILAALSDPVALHHAPREVSVGASLGVAQAPSSAAAAVESATSLLSRADAAMYAAKRDGKNRCVLAASPAVPHPRPERAGERVLPRHTSL